MPGTPRNEVGRFASVTVRVVEAWLTLPRSDKLIYSGTLTFLLLAWLFIGVLYTWDVHGQYRTVFLKRTPTFRFVFHDPYASYPSGAESEYRKRQDASGDWLPGTPELGDYLAYCKARYAVDLPEPIAARTACRPLTSAEN